MFRNTLIFKRILFKKIAINGKGEFSKTRETMRNLPMESGDTCNVLPRSTDSNGVIVVKIKRDLKYKGYIYFDPVRLLSYTKLVII